MGEVPAIIVTGFICGWLVVQGAKAVGHEAKKLGHTIGHVLHHPHPKADETK